jgi:hypothetical protein
MCLPAASAGYNLEVALVETHLAAAPRRLAVVPAVRIPRLGLPPEILEFRIRRLILRPEILEFQIRRLILLEASCHQEHNQAYMDKKGNLYNPSILKLLSISFGVKVCLLPKIVIYVC